MRQTLRHLRWLARDMGISVQELLRRRAKRNEIDACVDDTGTIKFRPRLFCDPDMPDSWTPIPKTVIRSS